MSLPGEKADAEGCTSILVPATHAAVRQVMAAQTWDLNPGDIDFVVAIQRKPANGPRTWSVTCAGCPSLIGMNEHGISVGTTNIKTRGSRVGIPYLSILHRAIRCGTLHEAGSVIEGARRAAAHTYWVADRERAVEWECTAESHHRREARDVPIVHTNHCLSSVHQRDEGEPASPSSLARLSRASSLIAGVRPHVDSLKKLFADRSDGVDSINRYPEDNQGTATDACIICLPAKRELWACRGPADRGEWVRLGFA
jgi:isopenicillin-N N-acyltransferase-like protein